MRYGASILWINGRGASRGHVEEGEDVEKRQGELLEPCERSTDRPLAGGVESIAPLYVGVLWTRSMGMRTCAMDSESTFHGFSSSGAASEASSSASIRPSASSQAPPTSSAASASGDEAPEAEAEPQDRPRPRWLASEFADDFAVAVASIPFHHRAPPVVGERFHTKNATMERLRDQAFAEGRAVVSGRHSSAQRIRARCRHQGETSKNTRNLTDATRQRKNTHTH